jgi:3-(3-hydroxy-phenyl)propionate hydroxylase
MEMRLDYVRSPDQDAAAPVRHPVIVVGAGPVGLALAIDLAQHGLPVVLLDEDDSLATGSRAICFAKRTLEIFDRLGCGGPMVERGVQWHVGRVFFGETLAYQFDLLPEAGHHRPAFINLQQYHVEAFLLERARALPSIDLRWRNRVADVRPAAEGVSLTIETPDGRYDLACDHLIAADGSRSTVRRLMGLETHGESFRDRFLIADVRMTAPFPSERWFWFDPPFHRGQSVLLHRQADDVWRIDFQLGWDADPVAERAPERVIPRVRALLGPEAAFELVWCSVYTFSCQRMERFRHGRVYFAGDAAHGVSPFGARGANGGVQDAENLAWKLALVVQGRAPDALLDSYGAEREAAADENILASTRSTDFITPKNAASRAFRDAALTLARTHPFARRLVNSGRLSVPAVLERSPLNTPDADDFAGGPAPGAVCADAPVRVDGRPGWLLEAVGDNFVVLGFGAEAAAPGAALAEAWPVRAVLVVPPGAAVPGRRDLRVLEDADGRAWARYDAKPGTLYLVRPDQHVAARWRHVDPAAVGAALARAAGRTSC